MGGGGEAGRRSGASRSQGARDATDGGHRSHSAASPSPSHTHNLPHHTHIMDDNFGRRAFGFPSKPFGLTSKSGLDGVEDKADSIRQLTSRPNSFSFNIQKFLNIKQEDIVEDDVQEYKVTTSQNDKEKHTEGKVEEEEKEEDEAGEGSEEQEADYRSILMSSYQLGSSQQHQPI